MIEIIGNLGLRLLSNDYKILYLTPKLAGLTENHMQKKCARIFRNMKIVNPLIIEDKFPEING